MKIEPSWRGLGDWYPFPPFCVFQNDIDLVLFIWKRERETSQLLVHFSDVCNSIQVSQMSDKDPHYLSQSLLHPRKMLGGNQNQQVNQNREQSWHSDADTGTWPAGIPSGASAAALWCPCKRLEGTCSPLLMWRWHLWSQECLQRAHSLLAPGSWTSKPSELGAINVCCF